MSRRCGARARRMRNCVYLPIRPFARTKTRITDPARSVRRIFLKRVGRLWATAVRSVFGQPRPAHFTRMRAPDGARTSSSEMCVERPVTRPAMRTIGNGSRNCAGRAAPGTRGAAPSRIRRAPRAP